ncbi:MAG TPA: hypothetical protein VFW33_21650 [Gemmataceae bacterium]|nr:hypothetical protein [Gemmataceae bacterium]
MSTAPAPTHRRHALGLPAGSIRSLLALLVLTVIWLLAVYAKTPEGKVPLDFIYLQYVMILILAHFFASHGNTIGRHVSQHSPLGLPSGTIRFLLLAGYVGLIVWLFYNKREFEHAPEGTLLLPLVLVSGFIVGFLVTRLVLAASPGGQLPFWFQDVQAWFALLAVIFLVIITIIHLFILPNIEESLRFSTQTLEVVVAAVVGFYFGARS